MLALRFDLQTLHAHFTTHGFKGFVTRITFPAVQFSWLPALALLGVPVVVIIVWIIDHAFLSANTFGWEAFGELALPLGVCICAAIVFLVPNPMHALLALLGVFFTTVLLYLGAGIIFVGLVFLIVYVGAVAVLFLFVIMLLNVKSLTLQELLLMHPTQILAMIFGVILLYHLYTGVFCEVTHSLLVNSLFGGVIEAAAQEAIAYYIRYQANDINIFTNLYTVHGPLFLVFTIILLGALLGAIILATVTTERSTTLADIRKYAEDVPTPSITFAYMAPTALAAAVTLSPSLELTSLSELLGVTFMSMYSYRDRRDLKFRRTDAPGNEVLRFVDRRRTASGAHFNGLNRLLTAEDRLPDKDLVAFYRPWYKSWDLTELVSRKGGRYAGHVRAKLVAKWGRQLRLAAFGPIKHFFQRRRIVIVRPQLRWQWRPERAGSLTRFERIKIKYRRVGISQRKAQKESRDLKWQQWYWNLDDIYDPVRPSVVGLRLWLRRLWITEVTPYIHYWAWRVHAFCAAFFVALIILPLVLVPFPWFLDDYDIAWSNLKHLHNQVYGFVTRYVAPIDTPDFLKEILTFALLYPASAWKIVLNQPLTMLALAAVYAYDAVLFTGGDLAQAELHESTCKYLRITSYIRAQPAPRTAAQIAYRRRHPDKGRTDVSTLLLAISAGSVSSDPSRVASSAESLKTVVASQESARCPVSWGAIFEKLSPIVDSIRRFRYSIRPVPAWWHDYIENATTSVPMTRLFCFLIALAIAYAISGIILARMWRGVYGTQKQISLWWHVAVLLVALDFWAVFYGGMAPLHMAFPRGGLSPAMNIQLVLKIGTSADLMRCMALYIVFLCWPLLPYFAYRWHFARYQEMDEYRPYALQRYINLYLRATSRARRSVAAPEIRQLTVLSIDDVQKLIDDEAEVARQLAEKARIAAAKPKFVQYKAPKEIKFDYDDRLHFQPRGQAHRYWETPFTEWSAR